MYIGALMPPRPIRPMKNPWPTHNGQGGPNVEIVSPRAIIREPQSTVQRVPTRFAIRPMRMPPTPEPSQASALASAGTDRTPPTSAAMSLSATAVIQAAPNAINMVISATVATAHDAFVSIDEEADCNIKKETRLAGLFTSRRVFDHPRWRRAGLSAALRQNARRPRRWKFPSGTRANNEIDDNAPRYSFHAA